MNETMLGGPFTRSPAPHLTVNRIGYGLHVKLVTGPGILGASQRSRLPPSPSFAKLSPQM